MTISTVLALLLAGCGSGADAPATNRTAGAEPPAAVPASPASQASATTAASANDFTTFWPRFRQAALTGDAAALKAMSAPTVQAHGELDDDPVRKLTPAQVPGEVAKLMASMDTLDAAGHTQRTLIEADKAAPQDGDGEQRVGNLVFKPDASGAWRLTDLYAGDE